MTPEELKAFLATGKKPASEAPKPETPAPTASAPSGGEASMSTASVPAYATALLEDLRAMASEEDFADVELSAASLAETLAVVQELPYPPAIFIDECLDAAVTALENQKRVYIQRVMSGEKQAGIRNKKKAVALAIDINLDDLSSPDGKDLSKCFVL